MGRITQFISFLNARDVPAGDEWKAKYTHITKSDALMKIRKIYRKQIKKEDK